MGDKGLVVHLPEAWLTDGTQMLPFYHKLFAGLDDLGVEWAAEGIDREAALARIERDGKFHIFNHGRVVHPRALNAGVAYIYPFWNLDPQGIRAFSSIGAAPFRAHTVDADKARAFLGKLRARWVDERASRYEQPDSREDLPEGAAAVFFQSEAHRGVGETCHMDRWAMLDAVLKGWDGPVIVKPHPREMDEAMFARLLEVQAREARLVISQGNIHDTLASAARVVTINSAVGIEAYLHRKPVILCGRADFHHIADVARSPQEVVDLLAAPARGRVYAKYLYWYFRKRCVDAGRADVATQVLRKIALTGYAME